jgi:hypothetical protein
VIQTQLLLASFHTLSEKKLFFVLTKQKNKFFLTFQIHLIDLTSSPQYYLEAKNTDLVTVDVANVRAGSNLDRTLIFLRDKNVDRSTDLGETELKSPSADIHIVDPDHISIEIDPYKSWIVLVGNQ